MKHSFHTRSTCPLFARWESWLPTSGDSEHPQIPPPGGKGTQSFWKTTHVWAGPHASLWGWDEAAIQKDSNLEVIRKGPSSAGFLCILPFNLVKMLSHKVVRAHLFLWCCVPPHLKKRHIKTPPTHFSKALSGPFLDALLSMVVLPLTKEKGGPEPLMPYFQVLVHL